MKMMTKTRRGECEWHKPRDEILPLKEIMNTKTE
jgi:hypothetical protein